MKPIVLVSVIAGSLLAGFLGAAAAVALVVERRAEAEVAAAEQARGEALGRAAASSEQGQPFGSSELDPLRGAIANLQREVDELRAELARREAPAEGLTAAGVAPLSVEALAELKRDAVVQIMEEERQRETQKREDERKAREQEMFNRLAERAAKDLGLSPADQQRLSEFMTVASTKSSEIFRTAREAGGPEGMRTAFEEFRTWRDTELKSTFGDNLGQQLIDYQREQMRGGFGGFGGGFEMGGGPGAGGQGGGTNTQGRTSGGRGR